MPLTTPRELFIHELSDAMSAEQQILKMLPSCRKKRSIMNSRKRSKPHEEETQQQVRNIQEVFRQPGDARGDDLLRRAGTRRGAQGVAQQPSPEILEMANLGGARSRPSTTRWRCTPASCRWPRILARPTRPNSCRTT